MPKIAADHQQVPVLPEHSRLLAEHDVRAAGCLQRDDKSDGDDTEHVDASMPFSRSEKSTLKASLSRREQLDPQRNLEGHDRRSEHSPEHGANSCGGTMRSPYVNRRWWRCSRRWQ
ncbi:hypothetical protein [Lentzea xinjiangensis]|uniref:hypothetical protein n=1 Tax=Lentzea xinjiangensis TaxID=402600 RepID=UPI0011605F83|nr:hypothetical protein [Lentzea xinjiangensis]